MAAPSRKVRAAGSRHLLRNLHDVSVGRPRGSVLAQGTTEFCPWPRGGSESELQLSIFCNSGLIDELESTPLGGGSVAGTTENCDRNLDDAVVQDIDVDVFDVNDAILEVDIDIDITDDIDIDIASNDVASDDIASDDRHDDVIEITEYVDIPYVDVYQATARVYHYISKLKLSHVLLCRGTAAERR